MATSVDGAATMLAVATAARGACVTFCFWRARQPALRFAPDQRPANVLRQRAALARRLLPAPIALHVRPQ